MSASAIPEKSCGPASALINEDDAVMAESLRGPNVEERRNRAQIVGDKGVPRLCGRSQHDVIVLAAKTRVSPLEQ